MNLFKNENCCGCDTSFDPLLGSCPNCGNRGEYFEEAAQYQNHVRAGTKLNVIFFLIGLFGFQIAGFIIQVLMSLSFTTHYSGDLENLSDALTNYLSQPRSLMISNGIGYLITFLSLILVSAKHLKEVFRTFKGFGKYLKGLGYGVALIITSMVVSIITQLLSPTEVTDNVNQSLLIELIDNYPVYCLIAFGLVGPLCEEFAYRAGLFSLLSRKSIKLAYILTPIIFGLIHFDFDCFSNGNYVNELLNLPSYVIAGLLLSYIYDKEGMSTSFIAHATNNVYSILLIILVK